MTTTVSEISIKKNPKDVHLVRSKLLQMKIKLDGIEDPIIQLVATQKGDVMKELVISKALLLLNDKNHLETSMKTEQKLNDPQVPPSSIRYSTKLTSPDPEVVASTKFQKYRDQFNAGLHQKRLYIYS